MKASEARELAKAAPSMERIREAIKTAAIIGQSTSCTVPAEWMDAQNKTQLRIDGYKIEEGWHRQYQRGYVISWR